jgi:tryptophanyl-tRNA synthetase
MVRAASSCAHDVALPLPHIPRIRRIRAHARRVAADAAASGSNKQKSILFLEIDVNTHTPINIYLYGHTHIHSISINISERLNRFNLKIHEVGH